MANKTLNHEVPTLVLTVLRSVDDATSGKRSSQWVDVGSLDLDDEEERVDASLVIAERLGWVQTEGVPPHSVAITAEGRRKIAGG